MSVNKIMTYVLGGLALIIIILLLIPVAPREGQRSGPKIIVFGDSLVSEYELPKGTGFTAKLQEAFDKHKIEVNLVGMGVPGDTTEGGLNRINNVISAKPKAVIIVLGANDMLRSIDPEITKANLNDIINRFQENNIDVFLTGMMASPTYGTQYQTTFDRIFPDLAQEHQTGFYYFFLDGVAGEPSLNLPDGIHPNEQGINEIVMRIFPAINDFVSLIQAPPQEEVPQAEQQ